ncbi:MAG: methyltransferase domain-containing protein [Microthrixaceae bacterium]
MAIINRLSTPFSVRSAVNRRRSSGSSKLAAAARCQADMDAASRAHTNQPSRDDRVNRQIVDLVAGQHLEGRTVLEVGGRNHPRSALLEGSGAGYVSVDLDGATGDGVLVADICSCPEIETASMAMVLSVDVFEHLAEPWNAAAEISRILEPGGVVYTSTLFSWRYHPVPEDYYRYTPAGLEHLFGSLDTISSGFDTTERRRNLLGTGYAAPLEPDAFGGWRENWRVFHAGRKPHSAGAVAELDRAAP